MKETPIPKYDEDINKLVKAYKKTLLRIQNELNSIDLTDFTRAVMLAKLNEISGYLSELNEEAATWVTKTIPLFVTDGICRTLVNLELASNLTEARKKVKLNRIDKNMIAVAIADTQEDLLAVTNRIDNSVRKSVRKVYSDVIRENMAAGINGQKTIKSETLTGLKKELGSTLDNAIIYSDGRRVKAADYVDMMVKTKAMDTYNTAHLNEALSRSVFYGVISSHGAKDACSYHEGRIVKLNSDAEGDYPTLDELKGSRQIFHHRCKHSWNAVRLPELLPESVLAKAEKQAELGDRALATGKRNPILE